MPKVRAQNKETKDQYVVCKAIYPTTGLQAGPVWGIWWKDGRICKRCVGAGRDARRNAEQPVSAVQASQASLVEALREIVEDAVGEQRDPLWIVDRELILKAANLLRQASAALGEE